MINKLNIIILYSMIAITMSYMSLVFRNKLNQRTNCNCGNEIVKLIVRFFLIAITVSGISFG